MEKRGRGLTLLLILALGSSLLTPAQEQTKEIIPAPGLEEKKYIGPLRDAYDRMDPTRDGWETEAFSAAAMSQLSALGKLLEKPGKLQAKVLAPFFADQFACSDLRPGKISESYRDGALRVLRASGASPGPLVHKGRPGFGAAVKAWFEAAGFAPSKKDVLHTKFKVFRIRQSPDGKAASSGVLCTVTIERPGQRVQVNARWDCEWDVPDEGSPRLTAIKVSSYEEVAAAGPDGGATPLFGDATASVLGETAAYRDQFLRGSDYWRLRLPRDLGLDVVANHGLAVGDVNGDQLEDLYICQQGGLPNRLFVQNPDGTLRDYTAESNTGWLDYCASALIVDLDNDGDRDLVVSQDFKILFMDNVDGKGRFELAFGHETKAQTFSLSAVDVDLDGRLDIYSCGYNPSAAGQRAGAMGEPIPFHDANNGGANILWRNAGDWEFVDVTRETGLDVNNRRFSFCASWEDYDNDGDLDLYVANDYGRNCLYRNDSTPGRPRFREVADALGVQDTSAGMSTNWADFNRDGWMDLYVSNMFSSAGNRITYQKQFLSDTSEQVREQFQRMARGNTLFQSDGKGGFLDRSEEAGVTMGRWAWGSAFVDFNGDGWEDILVANGFITTEDTGDL